MNGRRSNPCLEVVGRHSETTWVTAVLDPYRQLSVVAIGDGFRREKEIVDGRHDSEPIVVGVPIDLLVKECVCPVLGNKMCLHNPRDMHPKPSSVSWAQLPVVFHIERCRALSVAVFQREFSCAKKQHDESTINKLVGELYRPPRIGDSETVEKRKLFSKDSRNKGLEVFTGRIKPHRSELLDQFGRVSEPEEYGQVSNARTRILLKPLSGPERELSCERDRVARRGLCNPSDTECEREAHDEKEAFHGFGPFVMLRLRQDTVKTHYRCESGELSKFCVSRRIIPYLPSSSKDLSTQCGYCGKLI